MRSEKLENLIRQNAKVQKVMCPAMTALISLKLSNNFI